MTFDGTFVIGFEKILFILFPTLLPFPPRFPNIEARENSGFPLTGVF